MGQLKKSILIGLFSFSIILTAILFLSALNAPSVTAQAQPTPVSGETLRTVMVTGSGSINATPDQAVVQFGVQTQAETAAQALSDNNDQMTSLISTLRGAGIANADIQTMTIQLFPEIAPQPTPAANQDDRGSQIANYTAVNTVSVTVREIDNLGTLLDQVVSAGGNRIDYISFDVSDPSQSLDQAREAAFQNATAKATQLASLAGLRLGSVVTIVETTYIPSPVTQESALRMDEAAKAVPISPGSRTYTIDIQVTFELVGSQQGQ